MTSFVEDNQSRMCQESHSQSLDEEEEIVSSSATEPRKSRSTSWSTFSRNFLWKQRKVNFTGIRNSLTNEKILNLTN